jgi:hypothetical protein
MGGTYSTHEVNKTTFLWRNLREEPPTRSTGRLDDNIKINLREMGLRAWTGFA